MIWGALLGNGFVGNVRKFSLIKKIYLINDCHVQDIVLGAQRLQLLAVNVRCLTDLD